MKPRTIHTRVDQQGHLVIPPAVVGRMGLLGSATVLVEEHDGEISLGRSSTLPYGMGWWAFTVPLGAFTASTLALGRGWQAGALEALAVSFILTLVVAWAVVSVSTLCAVRSGAAWRR